MVSPDELRKLAANATDRRRQEQQEQEERKQGCFDHEWAKAREAVANLDNVISQAASLGHRAAVIYEAKELPGVGSAAHANLVRKRYLKKRLFQRRV